MEHMTENHVHRTMKKINVHSVIRKRKIRYLNSKTETTAENIIKRNFFASKANEKRAADVTEFKDSHSDKKMYLSVIIDLYDRSLVSYVIGNCVFFSS